jgi:hypothetical protein
MLLEEKIISGVHHVMDSWPIVAKVWENNLKRKALFPSIALTRVQNQKETLVLGWASLIHSPSPGCPVWKHGAHHLLPIDLAAARIESMIC